MILFIKISKVQNYYNYKIKGGNKYKIRVVDDYHGEGRECNQKGLTLCFQDKGVILFLQLHKGTKLHIALLLFKPSLLL